MTPRVTLALFLAAAACASAPARLPAAPDPASQAPLPRSSIVAVLAHRGELELNDEQVAALEQADAALQLRLVRLHAEGGLPAPPAAGDRSGPGGGGPPTGGGPGSPGGPGGGRGPGFGMNMGPGGLQPTPGSAGGGHGGGHAGGGPPGSGGRHDLLKEQKALEARLDDADTAAFLQVEPALAPAQRERAREIAAGYRERLFERREQQRGR